jgi:hypothetical protein
MPGADLIQETVARGEAKRIARELSVDRKTVKPLARTPERRGRRSARPRHHP